MRDWGSPGWVVLLPHWNQLTPDSVAESGSESSHSTSLIPRAQARGHMTQAALVHAREASGTLPLIAAPFFALTRPLHPFPFRDFLLFALPEAFLRKSERCAQW